MTGEEADLVAFGDYNDFPRPGVATSDIEPDPDFDKFIEEYDPRPHKGKGRDKSFATETGFHLTDLGNAKRLVARHGNRLHYCHSRKKWLLYDGTRWKWDDSGEVLRLAKDTVASIYQEAAQAADTDTRKQLAAHAARSESEARLQAMVSLAQSEEGIPVTPAQLDVDTFKMNVRNGTLDLLTGLLLPHDPADLITKMAPVTVDPDATAQGWYAFLYRIMGGNENLIRFLRRFFGYAMTGSTAEQCLCLGHGTGANGKTTLIETAASILGDYAATADFSTFALRGPDTIRNDLARLQGARLVTAIEAADGVRFDEVTIKRLTGGDTIAARFLYGEYFEFKPQFKLFLAANHKPRIKGTDHAIWRRIRLIPFNVTIPDEEQDKRLPEKLLTEAPGILNWMIEGCLTWRREGLGIPEEVRTATALYRDEEDPLSDFLADCCITGKTLTATAYDLYAAYLRWAQENGERPLSQKSFGGRLTERGFDHYRTGAKRKWFGLGLRAVG